MTSGSTAIFDASGRLNFTAADIGQPIWVIGAEHPIASGAENGMLRTVIVAVTDSTHATTQEPADETTGDISSNTTIFRQRGWPLIASGNVQFSLTSHDVASFTFLDELPKPVIGQPVLFRIHGDDTFGGTIDNIVGSNVPGSPLGQWAIDCVSWDSLSYKRTTGEPTFSSGSPAVSNPQNGLFTNMTVAEIMRFLIVNALGSEGLDFVGAVDGPVIPTFTASYAQCGDAFDQLVKSGSDTTTFLHWFTDTNKKIWLADQTTFTAPWDIDGSNCDGSLLAAVQCTWDRSEFIDRAIVRLSNEISDPVTQSFVGDSSTKTFQMANPVASTPTITENGTPVSVGVLGINTGSAWYWNQGSTAITQDPAGAPLSPSVTLAVTAPLFVQGIVASANAAAQEERQEVESGTGLYEAVIQQDNPATATDGETLAAAIAGQYGVIPKRIQIKTYRPGLKIGQNISVTLSIFGLSAAPFCISDVEITTDDNVILYTVTMVGSPLINWDYRATLATLRPGTGGNGIGGGQPGPQMYWRTIDINDTTPGTNIAPNLTNQGTGRGIKITGVLRKAISADLVVRVNSGDAVLGTLTIPAATPIKTKVETAITDQNLVSGATMTWDITGGDSQQDKNGVATVTVQWGVVTQVQVMGQWMGPYSPSADYKQGDAVSFDGSSWISLQDANSGNQPDTSPAFWDIVALRGSPGIGVPAGGTTGQVLGKLSNTDYDDGWIDVAAALPLTTKGDLLTYGPAGSPVVNQPVRFPVGSNGKVLTADSAQPDGIVWDLATIETESEGIPIGTRPILNFIAGTGITITITDDPGNNRVNITISATLSPSGGSSGLWTLLGFGPVVGGIS
jgi:hypothetical protein